MGLIERLLLFLNGERSQGEKGIGFLAEENQEQQNAEKKDTGRLGGSDEKKALSAMSDGGALRDERARKSREQGIKQSDVMRAAIVGQEDIVNGEESKGNGGGIGFVEANADLMERNTQEDSGDAMVAQWILGQQFQAEAEKETKGMTGSMVMDLFSRGAGNVATGNLFSAEGSKASGKLSPITQQGNRDVHGLLTKIYERMQGKSTGNSAPHVSLHLEKGKDGADIDGIMEAVSGKLWEARQSGMKRRRGE